MVTARRLSWEEYGDLSIGEGIDLLSLGCELDEGKDDVAVTCPPGQQGEVRRVLAGQYESALLGRSDVPERRSVHL